MGLFENLGGPSGSKELPHLFYNGHGHVAWASKIDNGIAFYLFCQTDDATVFLQVGSKNRMYELFQKIFCSP